jgi:antitoxin component of RelBE/YafQ-DinJ toxin-antitoxin module
MAKDAWIQIRIEKSKREEIKKEAKKRNMTVSQLMLEGYETLREGKYIDFK